MGRLFVERNDLVYEYPIKRHFANKIEVYTGSNVNIKDISKDYFTLYGTPEIQMNTPMFPDLIIEDKTNYKIIWSSKNIMENRRCNRLGKQRYCLLALSMAFAG